jgi:hypothetical protein
LLTAASVATTHTSTAVSAYLISSPVRSTESYGFGIRLAEAAR